MEKPITPTPTQEPIKKQLGQLMPQKSNIIGIGKYWYLFVIIALLGVIAFGGYWVVTQRMLKSQPTPTPSPSAEVDQPTAELEEQSLSDEIEAIERDLEATELNNLDKELSDIDSELSSP